MISCLFPSVRLLREELQLLQEQGSYVGEVVKAMDKKKVLVKVHPEGKFVVDMDKSIDVNDVTPNCRVALRNDTYTLHKILPNKVAMLQNLESRSLLPCTTYVCIGVVSIISLFVFFTLHSESPSLCPIDLFFSIFASLRLLRLECVGVVLCCF